MSVCQYCGENAGFPRREHRRCRERHDESIQDIHHMANMEIAKEDFNEAAMRQHLMAMAAQAHVTEQEVNAAITASWTRGVGHPKMGIVTAAEESDRRVFREFATRSDSVRDNQNHAMNSLPITDRFLLRAHWAALGEEDGQALLQDLEEVRREQIGWETGRWIMTRGWETAVESLLEKGIISLEQEVMLARYAERNRSAMDFVQKSGAEASLAKAAILRDISLGIVPQRRQYLRNLSPQLSESERLVWATDHTERSEPPGMRRPRAGVEARPSPPACPPLESRGLRLREGTIVDATIIEVPSSTKNQAGQRDPEMHQTKKGNQWHFGMKLHIGVDAVTGLVHSLTTTPSNVHDVTETHRLLHGGESQVWGDAGYVGVQKREENRELKVDWQVAMRPGPRRKLEPGSLVALAEKVKASVGAKVSIPSWM